MQLVSKKVVFLISALSCCLLMANSFVVKKKSKGPSVATLKQECGEELGALLKLFSQILQEMGGIQELGVTKTYELLEDDKQSFFACAGKEQLSCCLEKMRCFKEKMVAMQSELQGYRKFMRELKRG